MFPPPTASGSGNQRQHDPSGLAHGGSQMYDRGIHPDHQIQLTDDRSRISEVFAAIARVKHQFRRGATSPFSTPSLWVLLHKSVHTLFLLRKNLKNLSKGLGDRQQDTFPTVTILAAEQIYVAIPR